MFQGALNSQLFRTGAWAQAYEGRLTFYEPFEVIISMDSPRTTRLVGGEMGVQSDRHLIPTDLNTVCDSLEVIALISYSCACNVGAGLGIGLR